MFLFGKPASPYIVWRNRAMPHGMRKAKYHDTVPEGRKYKVLEQACPGDWVVVTVLTVVEWQTEGRGIARRPFAPPGGAKQLHQL